MSKARTAFEILLKILRKKQEKAGEVQADTPEGAFNEGEKMPSYGLNRKLIYAVGGMIVVVFISCFYFSVDSTDKKKKEPLFEAAGKNVQSSLPNDYEEMSRLAKYDERKQPKSQITKAQPPIRGEAVEDTQQEAVQRILAAREKGNVPKIPGYNAGSLPFYAAQDMVAGIREETQSVKREKDFDSAIRFALVGTESAEEPKKENAQMRIENPASDQVLLAGTVIPAILQTGINSDLNGQVIAQVQENVFDSVTGENVLIPRGSRLIGSYDGQIESGQSRLRVGWSRLIFPDGSSCDLGDMQAISGAGYAGLKDQVDKHSEQVLGAAAFTSVFAALGSVAAGNTKEDYYSTGQLASRGAAENLLNTAASLINKNINQKPTITVRPGFSFHVLVNADLSLKSWGELYR